MMRRPSLIVIWPRPRDTPISWRDTTSYEPSSRIVRVTSSGSEPDRYTTPFHVPATDLTSDTATGRSPALAQPTSEAANPTTTMVVKMVQSDRALFGVIASLLLFESD